MRSVSRSHILLPASPCSLGSEIGSVKSPQKNLLSLTGQPRILKRASDLIKKQSNELVYGSTFDVSRYGIDYTQFDRLCPIELQIVVNSKPFFPDRLNEYGYWYWLNSQSNRDLNNISLQLTDSLKGLGLLGYTESTIFKRTFQVREDVSQQLSSLRKHSTLGKFLTLVNQVRSETQQNEFAQRFNVLLVMCFNLICLTMNLLAVAGVAAAKNVDTLYLKATRVTVTGTIIHEPTVLTPTYSIPVFAFHSTLALISNRSGVRTSSRCFNNPKSRSANTQFKHIFKSHRIAAFREESGQVFPLNAQAKGWIVGVFDSNSTSGGYPTKRTLGSRVKNPIPLQPKIAALVNVFEKLTRNSGKHSKLKTVCCANCGRRLR